jgi:hypothetical protein
MFSPSPDRRRLLAGLAAAFALPGLACAQDAPALFDVTWNVKLSRGDRAALEAWVARLQALAPAWWATITTALASPGFTPVSRITLEINEIMPKTIPAVTFGTRIVVDAGYVRGQVDNPDRLRMVGHEMVHVAQAYPENFPHWLSEGIADYLRYYVLFPDDPARAYDPANIDLWFGYTPLAGLLDFIEQRHPGTVKAVNADLRTGGDGLEPLEQAAGPLTRAWRDYMATHPAAATPEAVAARARALAPPGKS